MPLSKAIQVIVDQTKELGWIYDVELNRQRRTTLRLLDPGAFSTVKNKLTHYALELSMREWMETKKIADRIEEGKEEEFEFDVDKGCSFGCELPARYCLPCKHWMYTSVIEQCQLPLSLFHPRWHFDGPAVLHDHWVMKWDSEEPEARGPTLADRHSGDRYAAHGLQRAEESAFAILDRLKSLPPGLAESFANSFARGAESLLAAQDKQLASWENLRPVLPEPLKESTSLQYRKGKRRAMTGVEAAEERERDISRQCWREEREAAALAVAEREIEEREARRLEEIEWVADTQFSRLNNLLPEPGEILSEATVAQLSTNQDVPLAISSNSNNSGDNEASDGAASDGAASDGAASDEVVSDGVVSDGAANDGSASDEPASNDEPRRSGRVRKKSKVLESQQWQIDNGLIPEPTARAKARALNTKRRRQIQTSQLIDKFDLLE